ncbi:anoctamin-8-like isoform X1 [Paramuricea clavata]|uniref:Anoctamin n=1 Tax=Paramuricea clavata TaxID=317549 RepID=A0A6S7GFW7_PARCT|nr:anoctamin-8-like isoform X1 [Paramuricea clavata]
MPIPEGMKSVRERVKVVKEEPADATKKKSMQSAGRFVIANKIWQKSTVTRTSDVVIIFPPKTEDYVVMWLLSRLRSRIPEVEIHVRQMADKPAYGFFLTSSIKVFMEKAEEMGLRKKLKDGGMAEFSVENQDEFLNIEDPELFFTSGDRQSIVMELVNNMRAVEGDELAGIKFVPGQTIVPKLLVEEVIQQIFPLHDHDDLAKLRKTWVKAFFKKQPLDDIRDYFGVKIAMYFGWLGLYTKWLFAPAIFGIIMFVLMSRGEVIRDWCMFIFSIFNIVWATLYLEAWKRKSAELAYRWGTLDMPSEALKDPRVLFEGEWKPSHITGKMEPTYPSWKRNLFRYCVTLPAILTSLVVVFLVMILVFEFQRWVDGMDNPPKWLKFAPKIALAVSIGKMDDIYKTVAYKLNDKENYRLDETYENHLIIKLVSFQFFNAYLSLFYIAFSLMNFDKLKTQLGALLITKQVIGNVKEALVPFVKQKVKEFKKKKDEEKKRKEEEKKAGNASTAKPDKPAELETAKTKQPEIEAAMPVYEDTFEDYLEMFIQFGYVVLFSAAFPLAGLCALLNNVVEIRSDAFKLCTNLQRPFGVRVENIGTWQDAMELMGVIAVIVNLALLGIGGSLTRMFPGMTPAQRILLIIVIEHVVLAVKFAVSYAIPDIPEWVEDEIAKVEYKRREAEKAEKLAQRNNGGAKSPVS